MRRLAARASHHGGEGLTNAMIRIDALWMCSQPQDMRAGADRLLTVVVNTLGEARAHHGYLFANARRQPAKAARARWLRCVGAPRAAACWPVRLAHGRGGLGSSRVAAQHSAVRGADVGPAVAAPGRTGHHRPLLIERYDGRGR